MSASFLTFTSQHHEVLGTIDVTPCCIEVNSSFVTDSSNLVFGQKYLFPFHFSSQNSLFRVNKMLHVQLCVHLNYSICV